MSTEKQGPASSHFPDNWHAINWHLVQRKVRGLQVRIAQATKEGQGETGSNSYSVS